MDLPEDFKKFLSDIEPSSSFIQEVSQSHRTLRSRLAKDDDFKTTHVDTWLSGSYKKNTCVRTRTINGRKKKADVDIVVIVNKSTSISSPKSVLQDLNDVLKKYYDNVKINNRSCKIELEHIKMDVVPAVALDGLESLLQIPDKNADQWIYTNPQGHIKFITDENTKSGGLFVPLVKMFKWWWGTHKGDRKRPNGFILECIAAETYNHFEKSKGKAFVELLETISNRFQEIVDSGAMPFAKDPGIPSNNVLDSINTSDFNFFLKKVKSSLSIAREALDCEESGKSSELWRKVFGDCFPQSDSKLAAEEATRKIAAGAGISYSSNGSVRIGEKNRNTINPVPRYYDRED